jgi:hypothetical protein
MKLPFFKPSLAILAVLAISGTAAAQTTPAPTATDVPTSVPSQAATASPAPMRTMVTAPPSAKPQIKKLKTATLSTSQLTYALTHQVSEAKQLAHMKKINFDNIRIVRLTGPKLNLLQRLHIRVDTGEQTVAFDPFMAVDTQSVVAQATSAPLPATNGNNSPIQYLHNVLANINVSNALNNLLNNSTVNANVSLSNVLNNNKIAIGQVVGIYIGGGGIINTVIK